MYMQRKKVRINLREESRFLTPTSCHPDIEAALQVDSAEENNRVGVVVPAGQNTDGVEILDIMEQELKDEVQESTPIPDVQQVKPEFVAHLQIVDLPANVIFIAGYKAILHIHSAVEECEIIELISQIDLKTRKPMKTKKIMHVSKNGTAVVCRIQVSNSIRVENFSDFLQFGKFTLRTQGKTIAVGIVTEFTCASSSA
ncbi:uncharacterized protein LOC108841557 isoform X2 [Raphanus sativus]|uniref:Uncharacterized protein LOC108841557 isoform X2 n=1 Tax=Raphanus sativus TaxID=3726 RepID=A0A9W3CAT6_RAPSA|nr:uncharacterized protein LOC108841557 isoform X2 [Raphanus sativus]